MNDNAETVRRALIERVERYAKLAAQYRDARKSMPDAEKAFLFDALADVGAFNRKHPERAIPPLDPITCRVREPRFV